MMKQRDIVVCYLTKSSSVLIFTQHPPICRDKRESRFAQVEEIEFLVESDLHDVDITECIEILGQNWTGNF